MIPKKLHYCWFGPNPKSKVFEQCFLSWKKFCPDFEIIEWNEKNTKHITNSFFKNALHKKKYAFASDFIRTKILYEQGGIYLDTDMLLVKSIDELLSYNFFTGEEVEGRVAYGFYGAIPKNHFLEKMFGFYENTYFNAWSPPVITHTFKKLVTQDNLKENEIIFQSNVFYPLPYELKNEDYISFLKAETYAVHLWDHSWKAKTKEETLFSLLNKLYVVMIDFVFYKYPFTYFKRYSKEFGRKAYRKIFRK